MNFETGYDENNFSDDVISRWGELSEELEDNSNLLHVQMASLGRLCLCNPDACSDVLAFLEDLLSRPDIISEIENAIAISFLEWPDLEGLIDKHIVPTKVAKVVKTQWDRGGNY